MFSSDRAERSLTRRSSIKVVLGALCAGRLSGDESGIAAGMLRNLPPRNSIAPTGTQFAQSVARMDPPQREHAILSNLLDGNLPAFLKSLVPVKLSYRVVGGATIAATIFAMPEYLAIGSDADYLRIPMNLHTAVAVADRFGFVLPTKKMVDAIYEQSASRLAPQPLPAGPQMTTTEYYGIHNAMIEKQAQTRGISRGTLIAGHKKDVVLTNRLSRIPGRIAIYGWHRAMGDPIQPLSTVHGADYADYSHGIRLIAGVALIDGRLQSVHNILRDPALAPVLSDEGTIRLAPAFGHV